VSLYLRLDRTQAGTQSRICNLRPQAAVDLNQPSPLWVDSVEKVENTAKKKFSQKLAGGGFLLRIRSSCEEEGRRKLLFKSTWSTVSDGFKRISGP
jgi:hypothetical protein